MGLVLDVYNTRQHILEWRRSERKGPLSCCHNLPQVSSLSQSELCQQSPFLTEPLANPGIAPRRGDRVGWGWRRGKGGGGREGGEREDGVRGGRKGRKQNKRKRDGSEGSLPVLGWVWGSRSYAAQTFCKYHLHVHNTCTCMMC